MLAVWRIRINSFYFDADQDPTFYFDADLDPNFALVRKKMSKSLTIFSKYYKTCTFPSNNYLIDKKTDITFSMRKDSRRGMRG